MAKLYFNITEIIQHPGLDAMLMNLVEKGIARVEKQGSFRSLYDIEIVGVAVYYKKNWRYDRMSQDVSLDNGSRDES